MIRVAARNRSVHASLRYFESIKTSRARSPSDVFSASMTAAFERRGGLADFVHILDMQVDQIAERAGPFT
jgi:hypothetical protein